MIKIKQDHLCEQSVETITKVSQEFEESHRQELQQLESEIRESATLTDSLRVQNEQHEMRYNEQVLEYQNYQLESRQRYNSLREEMNSISLKLKEVNRLRTQYENSYKHEIEQRKIVEQEKQMLRNENIQLRAKISGYTKKIAELESLFAEMKTAHEQTDLQQKSDYEMRCKELETKNNELVEFNE